jgi:hypothetical protein
VIREGRDAVYRHELREVRCLACAESDPDSRRYRPSLASERSRRRAPVVGERTSSISWLMLTVPSFPPAHCRGVVSKSVSSVERVHGPGPGLPPQPAAGRWTPITYAGGRSLPQRTGSWRVDAAVSVVPADPIARPGLLADDLLDDPGTRGALGRLRFYDDAVSWPQHHCSHPSVCPLARVALRHSASRSCVRRSPEIPPGGPRLAASVTVA